MGKFIYVSGLISGCVVIPLAFSEVLDYIRIIGGGNHPVYRNRSGLGFDAESIFLNRLVRWRRRVFKLALPD